MNSFIFTSFSIVIRTHKASHTVPWSSCWTSMIPAPSVFLMTSESGSPVYSEGPWVSTAACSNVAWTSCTPAGRTCPWYILIRPWPVFHNGSGPKGMALSPPSWIYKKIVFGMNVTVFISHLCHRFIPIAPEEIGFQVFYPFFAAHYLFPYKR